MTFKELFENAYIQSGNYGKKDEYIQYELLQIIEQLKGADFKNWYSELF